MHWRRCESGLFFFLPMTTISTFSLETEKNPPSLRSRSRSWRAGPGRVTRSCWIAMSALKHLHVLPDGCGMIDGCIPVCVCACACCVCACVRVRAVVRGRVGVRVHMHPERKRPLSQPKAIICKGGFCNCTKADFFNPTIEHTLPSSYHKM